MDSLSDSDDERFFDMPEEIEYDSDSDSDHSVEGPTDSSVSGRVSNDFSYDFWTQAPESVHDRRSRFLEQMGLSSNENAINKEEPSENIFSHETKSDKEEPSGNISSHETKCDKEEPSGNISSHETKSDLDCKNLDIRGVMGNSSSDYSIFSRRSSLSCSSTEEDDWSTECDLENDVIDKVRDLNICSSKNRIMSKLREVGSSRLVKMEKFQKNNVNSWLKQLKQKVHIKDTKGEASLKDGGHFRRTRVHLHKKNLKELSYLCEGQDFCAHMGLILAMKFSPDGRFLASAGEDAVVRVWQVVEEERESNLESQCFDWNERKSKKPGCVIVPPKVFRIAEKPLHEFRGHCGEVLALSWSSNESLLSSSVDKTVRLWKIGHDECLQVFSHNNYVTCVEFNPVDENYFISGSIDGKIRIWEVSGCQVVDWIDIKEIVSAVCYYPTGKRAIVGSMDGSCRFYDITENQLQLDTQIFLPGKKKLLCKRITGFQFSPSDSGQVLVTSADSQVRVVSRSDVIFKIKGPRMSGNQMTASFTEDGKHIVSGSEDSNVHVWDYNNNNKTNPPKAKKSIGSRESFVSQNSFIAVPWCGIKTKSTSSSLSPRNDLLRSLLRSVPFDSVTSHSTSSSDCFPMGRGIFMTKGYSATWPEERLDDTNILPSIDTYEFQILSNSHMWGLVIVTAGRDGRIRTYHNYGLPAHL